MLWRAHIQLSVDYRRERDPRPDPEAPFLDAFATAAQRIDSVRSVWRAPDTPAAVPWESATRNVFVEFNFDGDEPAASEHAFYSIYHPAFDEAVTAVGDRRPSAAGAGVHVERLATPQPSATS